MEETGQPGSTALRRGQISHLTPHKARQDLSSEALEEEGSAAT